MGGHKLGGDAVCSDRPCGDRPCGDRLGARPSESSPGADYSGGLVPSKPRGLQPLPEVTSGKPPAICACAAGPPRDRGRAGSVL